MDLYFEVLFFFLNLSGRIMKKCQCLLLVLRITRLKKC